MIASNADISLRSAADLLADSPREALPHLRQALAERPGDRQARQMLAQALQALGKADAQKQARDLARAAETDHPQLLRASEAMRTGDLQQSERILRSFIAEHPGDLRAVRLLAGIARHRSRWADAERLLTAVLEQAPDFDSARFELAATLHELNQSERALEQLDRLLDGHPDWLDALKLKASVLGRMGRNSEANRTFERAIELASDDPSLWIMYGHALRIENRVEEAIAAYRRAIAIRPATGQAWWALANIKTVPLGDDDIAEMSRALSNPGLVDEEVAPIRFALGKAFEDGGDAAEAFEQYSLGNALAAKAQPYDEAAIDALVERSKTVLTADVLDRGPAADSNGPTPIFVVSMPRSGSTLVEQILGSHSQVEATWELPYLVQLAGFLDRPADGAPYPDSLLHLSPEQLSALGQAYLEQSRASRSTDRRYFIDKNPNNWRHVGLIRMILPQAKVIDVRRHPLDCGFSNFRQLYARGHEFAYALDSIGHYYSRYVELMSHWDSVEPGYVHRVIYEQLVDHPDQEIRAMLGFLGLEFEPACLAFHRNRRAIRTPSSEQVQQPLNRAAVGRWQIFDERLDPLRDSLGAIVSEYPRAPRMFRK